MRIKQIQVRNFRALRNSSMDLAGTTALIGENNAGKSGFLLALDLFFANAPRITQKDFSDDNTGEPIDITVVFHELTPGDLQEFSANLLDGELTLTRRFIFDGGGESGKFFVSARVNPEFISVRAESGKTEKRKLYSELRLKFHDLPKEKNADEIDGLLESWEEAHQESLSINKVASFKGWTNVGVGKLKQRTSFVLVRAVQNAAEDIQISKTSPVRSLVDAIAKQTIENSEEFQEFVASANARIRDLTDPGNVPVLAEIGQGLTAILSRYYRESQILTSWQPVNQIQPAFPTAQIDVKDNEFVTGLDGVGHGLQRAIILAVLQYMVAHTATAGQNRSHFREAQSDLILAIEEPEIYQHPTKQRMFGDVLRNLSRGFSTETGIRVQVLFVTHSPLLISLPRCDEIRLVRRVNDGHTNNVIAASTSLQSCSERSAVASGRRADEAFSPTQYAAKLHTFDSRIAEGFFARKVLLVEGVGDKAVLEAYYCLDGRNPQAEGIVIAQVDGKNNLDRPIVVFKSLGVPCFWVFDNDRTEGEKKESKKAGSAKNTIDTNRILQRLADVREEDLVDWPVGVTAAYASWDSKIEKYIRSKVADPQVYERIIAAVSSEFDIERDMCLKFPASASRMLARLSDEGVRFPELAELVERVDAL